MQKKNNAKATSSQALDRLLVITIFTSFAATYKKIMEMSLRELEKWILNQSALTKKKLPWLKLARFGNDKSLSPSGKSYRTNANMEEIDGIEGDYDGERLSLEEAVAKLTQKGVAALLYTTASHTVATPRYRIFCPLSETKTSEMREEFVALLNGIFDGVLDPASFTPSQAFYAGSVDGEEPVQTALVEGQFIDKVRDLKPIYKYGGSKKPEPAKAEPAEDQSELPGAVEHAEAMLEIAKQKISEAKERTPAIFQQAFWMGGFVACNTLSEEEVLDALMEAAETVGHQASYGESETERTIRNGLAEGERFPLPWFDPINLIDECWTPEELEAKYKEALDEMTRADIEELVGLVGGKENANLPTRVDGGTPMMRGNKPIINLHNTTLYLGRHLDTILPGLAHNQMTHRDEWSGGEIDDEAISLVRMAIERRGLETVGKELVADAVKAVARKLAYHPIRDYLSSLRWDGKPRLDTWLIRLAGVEDTPYTRAVSRKFLIQMVARVMRPGCKADYTMVWSGEQGQDKSKACRILAGGEYFSDSLPSIRGNKEEALRHLQGLWLIELAELAPSRTADQEDQKAFLSGSVDRVRMPYARLPQSFARQCVFVGTTNDEQFLKDPTGGRRYWPVTIKQVFDTEALQAERDQLFAEAMTAFVADEPWWLDREFEAEHAKPIQAAAYVSDSWEEDVVQWLDKPVVDELDEKPQPKTEATLAEVLSFALGVPTERQSMAQQKRAANVLRQIGWTKHHTGSGNVWRRSK